MENSAFRIGLTLPLAMHSAIDLRCPTCRALWRGVTICARCGTDLAALMRVAVRAWELREAARTTLCAGDRAAEALTLARAACRLHTTPHGQRLLALGLLATGRMAEACDLIEQLLDAGPASG